MQQTIKTAEDFMTTMMAKYGVDREEEFAWDEAYELMTPEERATEVKMRKDDWDRCFA